MDNNNNYNQYNQPQQDQPNAQNYQYQQDQTYSQNYQPQQDQTYSQNYQYQQGQPNAQNYQYQQGQPNAQIPLQPGINQKSRIVAGVLGILLGGLGVHNFYLGHSTRGALQLVLTLCSCGIASIWGFIEGILILVGNVNTDANGIPLTD